MPRGTHKETGGSRELHKKKEMKKKNSTEENLGERNGWNKSLDELPT